MYLSFLLTGVAAFCCVAAKPVPAETSSARDTIPGKYIVTLTARTSLHKHLSHISKRSSLTIRANEIFSIGDSFQAYVADIARSDDVSGLASDPDVVSVEPDRIIRNIDNFRGPAKALSKRALVTQSPISNWGLGRISHRAAGGTRYVYDSTSGQGTSAYIVDTGVDPQHQQFAGRASHSGYSAVSGESTADVFFLPLKYRSGLVAYIH